MRPNVLFITVDQWRGDCLGAFGHPVVKTPNLDALASQGLLFANHFSQAAPCGPSRASMHTGLYMHSHRSVDNGTPLEDRFTNMALEARAHGYDPVLFGYTDTTLDPRGLAPGDPALRTYESKLPGYSDASLVMPFEEPQWIEWLAANGYDTSVGRDGLHHPDGAHYGPPVYAAEHTDTAFLTDKVLAEIADSHDGWFLHASYLRPHPPFVVPAPYDTMFDPSAMPAPVRMASRDEEIATHGLLRGLIAAGQGADSDPAMIGRLRAVYFAMIAEVDAQLGRLLAAVDLTNTVVVLTSDHGEMLGDHWLMGKVGFYPQAFHIPLIIAGAGVHPATDPVTAFTENVDLFPTIMELIGAPIPAQCQGASLMPFMEGGGPTQWRDAAHWEWDFRVSAKPNADPETYNLAVLHDDAGTYVHFAGGPPLFFDHADDPDLFVSRSADSSHATSMLDYAQRMLTWRLSTDFGELVNINQIR